MDNLSRENEDLPNMLISIRAYDDPIHQNHPNFSIKMIFYSTNDVPTLHTFLGYSLAPPLFYIDSTILLFDPF